MTSRSSYFYHFVKTRLGKAAIVWVDDGRTVRIVRICLPAPENEIMGEIRGLFPEATDRSCAAAAALAVKIQAFMAGRPVSFDTAALDMSRVAPYHRNVLAALAAIPRGSVMSYGGVASKTGAPGGARAAGQGCAKNPFPILFPCHRVIRSDGSLGGFGGGLKLKRALLEMEGIQFDKNGTVLPEHMIR